MLSHDPELIRLLHRERTEQLARSAQAQPASERRRRARPAQLARIAVRVRRPQIRLGEDM
jgi:hypothetical protein